MPERELTLEEFKAWAAREKHRVAAAARVEEIDGQIANLQLEREKVADVEAGATKRVQDVEATLGGKPRRQIAKVPVAIYVDGKQKLDAEEKPVFEMQDGETGKYVTG